MMTAVLWHSALLMMACSNEFLSAGLLGLSDRSQGWVHSTGDTVARQANWSSRVESAELETEGRKNAVSKVRYV
jgi:hypothetical protein